MTTPPEEVARLQKLAATGRGQTKPRDFDEGRRLAAVVRTKQETLAALLPSPYDDEQEVDLTPEWRAEYHAARKARDEAEAAFWRWVNTPDN